MPTTITNSTTTAKAAEPLAVLLVDPSEQDRLLVARLLRRLFGRRVRILQAGDGRAALELMDRQAIDAALVDLRLPDVDGAELLEEMAHRRPETATILLAGRASQAAAAEAVASGSGNDFLVKEHLDRAALSRALSGALGQARLRREHALIVRELCRSHEELNHFVRALSHDMVANFMVLDHSFSQLKRSLPDRWRVDVGQRVAHVEACLRESKRFLDDLVGLARTGRVEMEPGRVDLEAVVDEVVFEQRPLLGRRKVRVDVRRPLGIVWCNRHRLKQIITNLVRNAVLHGCDPAEPRITISSAAGAVGKARPADGGPVSIRVRDNGPGIAAEFCEEVFLPGRRLSQAAGEGSGMGLAIVRKIAEHYGGTVRVDPSCRSGTAMVVSLPPPPGESSGHPPHWGPATKADGEGRSLDHDAPHEDQRLRPHQPYGHRRDYHRP